MIAPGTPHPRYAPKNAPARSAPVILMELVAVSVIWLVSSFRVRTIGRLSCHSLFRLAMLLWSSCRPFFCRFSFTDLAVVVSVSSFEHEYMVIDARMILAAKNNFFIIRCFLMLNKN